MTQTGQHSPTPWRWEDDGDIIIVDCNGAYVGQTTYDTLLTPTTPWSRRWRLNTIGVTSADVSRNNMTTTGEPAGCVQPLSCPNCHSTRITERDEEGFYDCLGCGIWFDPEHLDMREPMI